MALSKAAQRKVHALIERRNKLGWKEVGALRTGICLWASQELVRSPHIEPSAAAFYYRMKREGRIHRHPKPGDIALWLGGARGYGHAAVVTGHKDGVWHVLSTDIRGAGSMRNVKIGRIHEEWGQRLVGFYRP